MQDLGYNKNSQLFYNKSDAFYSL